MQSVANTTDKPVDALIVSAPEEAQVEISYEDFKQDMFILAQHYIRYYHRYGDLDYEQLDQFILKIDPSFFTPIPDMDVSFDDEMMDRVFGYLCINCPGYPEYSDYYMIEIDPTTSDSDFDSEDNPREQYGPTIAYGQCSCGTDDIFDRDLCASCLEGIFGVRIDNCEVCQNIDYLDLNGRCPWHPVVPILRPSSIPEYSPPQ